MLVIGWAGVSSMRANGTPRHNLVYACLLLVVSTIALSRASTCYFQANWWEIERDVPLFSAPVFLVWRRNPGPRAGNKRERWTCTVTVWPQRLGQPVNDMTEHKHSLVEYLATIWN